AQQNAYYDCLTRSVSSLALALLVLIIGAALLETQHWYATFSAIVEALAFLLVLYQFYLGRRINASWVNARIQSEIIRQAGIVMAAGAASTNQATLDEDEKAKWEKTARDTAALRDKKYGELPDMIEAKWAMREAALGAYVASLTGEAFEAYLTHRVGRQLRWF